MIQRGSEFRKWDLHIHSPFTVVNNQFEKLSGGEPNVDKFIENIKNAGISAIGLTNYFNFNDEDFSLKSKLEQEGIVTFLNLELRLSNINKSGHFFDYHIIFDNKLPDKIIKNLLGQLKANIGAKEKAFNNLTSSEIEQFANTSFEKLIESLESDEELNGRYLKGFLSRGHGSATSDSDPKNMAVYEQICLNSDFVIHSSCNDASSCNDKKCKHNNLEKDREYWLKRSKYVRPVLQSSDAHSLEQIGTKYSWIKADLTFEGLKQIKFEPEYRISIEKEKPCHEKDELIIDRIQFKNKDIYLSEYLNTIIGGRSTGKSTLLNSIAKKLGRNIEDGMFSFENLDDFHVLWRDGQEDNSRKIEYIPQEYMFTLSRNNSKLNNLLSDIIRSKERDLELKNYEYKCNNLQVEISNLLRNYFSNIKSSSELIKPEADKQGTENRIREYQLKKQELLKDSEITDEERNIFELKNTELIRLQSEMNNHESDLQYINSIPPVIFDLKSYDNSISPSVDLRIKLGKIIERLYKNVRLQQEHEIKVVRLELEGLKQKTELEILQIENNDIYKKCLEATKTNSEIAKLDSLIEKENDMLKKIIEFESRLEQLLKDKKQIKTDLITKYKEYATYRSELSNSFKIEDGDNLKISINFSLKDLDSEFDYIDSRGHSKQNFFDKIISDFDNIISSIFEDESLTFKNNKNKLHHIEKFFTTNLFDYQFEIEYQGDKFRQMSPGKKAFIVLKLILEFSDSKVPVLIDQPEDNLDNRAIYNELTKYIKETKLKRQIIIVTHNPNLVVSGDAENIIIANQHSDESPNQDGEKFDYVNGSLENDISISNSEYLLQKQSIRTHVCEILEGGEDAFKNRENKYNFSN